MLWVPLLELYRIHTPKFFTEVWFFSKTCSQETISPTDFFNFFSFFMSYQNRDLAATTSGAKILILKIGGLVSFSVGTRRPMILNSFNSPSPFMMTKYSLRS